MTENTDPGLLCDTRTCSTQVWARDWPP